MSIKVDWTSKVRTPFRREFVDVTAVCGDSAATAARRGQLGIEVTCDQSNDVAHLITPWDSFHQIPVLPTWIHQAMGENNWTTPMPIQAQAVPLLLSGRNMIGIAQTGSGKTGAFLIPAIVHLHDQQPLSKWSQGPVILVVSPTRELAVQISEEAEKLLKHSSQSATHWGGLRSVCFYGGGKKYEQLRKFTQDGSHIVVATPGRLMDFCKEGSVSLARVTYFCLDEADRMLDMGFVGDMEEIGAAVRPERQTVFFSATWNNEVQTLARQLCTDAPVLVRVGRGGIKNEDDDDGLLAREGIIQQVVVVDFPQEARPWDKQEQVKRAMLDLHIQTVMALEDTKMIIFVNQKTFADELSNKFYEQGMKVDAIHGGRPQERRLEILGAFRKGETRLLIATDVIGRGLDIPKVSHVVVYNMHGVDDYIHRIGRTGRGKEGKGHALVFMEYTDKSPDTAKELIAVLQKSKQVVPPELQKIADDVAAGLRGSAGDWGRSGSWGNKAWGSKDWTSWSGGDGSDKWAKKDGADGTASVGTAGTQ